jgi:hypothetical protein
MSRDEHRQAAKTCKINHYFHEIIKKAIVVFKTMIALKFFLYPYSRKGRAVQ